MMKIGRVTIKTDSPSQWVYIDGQLYSTFNTFKDLVKQEHYEVYKQHIVSRSLTSRLTIKHKVNWESLILDLQKKELI